MYNINKFNRNQIFLSKGPESRRKAKRFKIPQPKAWHHDRRWLARAVSIGHQPFAQPREKNHSQRHKTRVGSNKLLTVKKNKNLKNSLIPKKSNIFLHKESNKTVVKLGDFGVSRAFNKSTQNSLSVGVGTLYYMSPEILNNKDYNTEVDIW